MMIRVVSLKHINDDSCHGTIGCFAELLSRPPVQPACVLIFLGRAGPPGSLALARWAGWSAVRVGRHVKCWSRSNSLPRWQGYGRERREGREGKRVTKRRRGKEGVERGKGPLAREGVLYLDICAALPPSSYSYAVADGAELPIYPGQIW